MSAEEPKMEVEEQQAAESTSSGAVAKKRFEVKTLTC
jgi:hypothetical protein